MTELTDKQLQELNVGMGNAFDSGEKILCMVKEYDGDNKITLVNFLILLKLDIELGILMDCNSKIREMFPVGSTVWINKEGSEVRITEATCLDQRAIDEDALVRAKLFTLSNEYKEVKMFEGQSRLRCVASDRKEN